MRGRKSRRGPCPRKRLPLRRPCARERAERVLPHREEGGFASALSGRTRRRNAAVRPAERKADEAGRDGKSVGSRRRRDILPRGCRAGAAASDARPLSQSAGIPPAGQQRRQLAADTRIPRTPEAAPDTNGILHRTPARSPGPRSTCCRAPAPRLRAVKTIRTRKTFHAPIRRRKPPRRTARSA